MMKQSNSKSKPPEGVFEKVKGSGVWWIRWTDERGKRPERKIGPFKAACLASEQVRSKVRLAHVAPELLESQQRPVSLLHAMNHFVDNSQNSARSQYEERRYKALWNRQFPRVNLRDVKPEALERWRTQQKRKGLKPSSIRRAEAFLSKVFSVAIRHQWASSNPVKQLDPIKIDNKKTRFFSPEELRKIREESPRDTWLTIVFAALTGLRQKEQFNLRREDVLFEIGKARLVDTTTKAQEEQFVELNEEAMEVLREILSRHNSVWVFPDPRYNGHPIDGKSFYRYVFKPLLAKLGIKGATWHTLRHTFASLLAQAGKSLLTIQRVMRQKSYQVAERYAHLTDKDAKEAVAALPRLLATPAATEKDDRLKTFEI